MDAHILQTGKFWVDAPCRYCNGTGQTELSEWCSKHPFPTLSDAFKGGWNGTGEKLPCGCLWEDGTVRSSQCCNECEGGGKGGTFVTLQELMQAIKEQTA